MAGTLCKFDVLLVHRNQGEDNCSKSSLSEERCHVEVCPEGL